MNIIQFIIEEYPIEDRVRDKFSDPYKLIGESDQFPYDKIGPDEYGQVTKLVEIDDTQYVPVMDIISMTDGDAKKLGEDFYEIWKEYMALLDVKAMNVSDILESVRSYQANRQKRKEQADVLAVQKV